MPTTLITGANRGLGLELARRSAADGWRVHATCRRPDAADALEALTREHPERVHVHALDVTDREAIDTLAGSLVDEAIDVLWLNAGLHGGRDQGPTEVDRDVWLEVFRVNTVAPLDVAGAFLGHVERAENGRVVLVSSVMGSVGGNVNGGNYVYRSTKAAANAVAKSLAIDVADRGITVVALHPGWARTDMGGPDATLAPEESASGMWTVVDGLTPARSGTFLDYRGTPLPW